MPGTSLRLIFNFGGESRATEVAEVEFWLATRRCQARAIDRRGVVTAEPPRDIDSTVEYLMTALQTKKPRKAKTDGSPQAAACCYEI